MTESTGPEAIPVLDEVLSFTHRLIAKTLRPGDIAIDATTGNGHDTLHLARCVGPTGLVIGLDVQPKALQQTWQRMAAAGYSNRVKLLHAGHETMAEAVPGAMSEYGVGHDSRPRAVCFNLGYLPGGDKTLATRPETTLTALDAALGLLAPGGILTVVLYSGHPGGTAERDAVLAWAEALSDGSYRVLHYRFLNRSGSSELVAVELR